MSGTTVQSAPAHRYQRSMNGALTPHERAHGVDEIDHLCLYACVILHAAAKSWFALRRSPSDCQANVSESTALRGSVKFEAYFGLGIGLRRV